MQVDILAKNALAKLKDCHELYETHLTFTHDLIENFVAKDLLNYITDRKNLQQLIDNWIVNFQKDRRKKSERMFLMLDEYLQQHNETIRKLKNLSAKCCPSKTSAANISIYFSINVNWPYYTLDFVKIKDNKNYEGELRFVNIRKNYARDVIGKVTDLAIKAVFVLASIDKTKSTFNVAIEADYEFLLRIIHTLIVQLSIEKVKALKLQKISVIGAFLTVVMNIVSSTKFRETIVENLYVSGDPLILQIKYMLITRPCNSYQNFLAVDFNL